MTNNHIHYDTLNMFVRTAAFEDNVNTDTIAMNSASYQEVLDHLAYCEECRNQVSMISTLQERWPDIYQQSGLSEDQHQLICDYIDGSLPPEEELEVKLLIDAQPEAMKAALYYQSHSDQMQHALAANDSIREHAQTETVNSDSNATSLKNYLSQIFSLRSPMIYTMALTAGIFAAILALLQQPVMQQDRIMIASYQDDPTIQFTEQNELPGIGFFSQSGSTSKPFEDIVIELITENSIRISWPEVDGATLYNLRIQVFNQGRKTVLKENSTKANHTIFELEPDNASTVGKNGHNKRYEWVLYGNTHDDRMFYASGGFVISRVDTEAGLW